MLEPPQCPPLPHNNQNNNNNNNNKKAAAASRIRNKNFN